MSRSGRWETAAPLSKESIADYDRESKEKWTGKEVVLSKRYMEDIAKGNREVQTALKELLKA